MLFAVALLVAATARAEVCKSELDAWQRAVERRNKAQQALADYQNSPVAPLTPGEDQKKLQQLQDNIEAANEDVKRTGKAHDRCLERPPCKKFKGGWKCTVAFTYKDCCLDKPASKGAGGNKK